MKLTLKKISSIINNWDKFTFNYSSKPIYNSEMQGKLFSQSLEVDDYEYVPCPLCEEKSYTLLYRETKFGIYKNTGRYHRVYWKNLVVSLAIKVAGENKVSSLLTRLLGKPMTISRLKKKRDGYPVARCISCGFLYRNPIYTPKMIEEAYNQDYLSFLTGGYQKNRYKKYDKILKALDFESKTSQFTRKRVLDIGCGHGLFLSYMKKKGWETYGLDFAKDCIEYAQQTFGIENAAVGNLTEDSFSKNYFDTVTLWSVAAHLEDPVSMFKNIHRVLRPGGCLIIYTVNAGGLQHQIERASWNGLHRNHLVFFTIKTLTFALNKAGFANITEGIDRRDYNRWVKDGDISIEEKNDIKEIMENPNMGNMMMVLASK